MSFLNFRMGSESMTLEPRRDSVQCHLRAILFLSLRLTLPVFGSSTHFHCQICQGFIIITLRRLSFQTYQTSSRSRQISISPTSSISHLVSPGRTTKE